MFPDSISVFIKAIKVTGFIFLMKPVIDEINRITV